MVKSRALNVLLVEDDETTMSLMEELILNSPDLNRFESDRGGKHTLYKAYDAEEGLDLMREARDIDLILLDYHLPKMNGNIFCRILRSSEDFHVKPSLWVLAHTWEQRIDLIDDILASGANDYMAKPIIPNAFVLSFKVAQYGIVRMEQLYRRLEVKQRIIEANH